MINKCSLIQINPTVGALEENARLILKHAKSAVNTGSKIICFPELCLSGYPPEDLILKKHFCLNCEKQIQFLKNNLPNNALIIIGSPLMRDNSNRNAAIAFLNGNIIGEYYKILLPNYGVFDEKRLFEPGSKPLIIEYENKKIAIHICEDSWDSKGLAVKLLPNDIDMIINLSASPYHQKKQKDRELNLKKTARITNSTLLYCNLVGGQDELVFDGGSFIISPDGNILSKAPLFKSYELIYNSIDNYQYEHPNDLEEVYEALKLGLKDYVCKTGFNKILIALSGGIDSALVLAIAVDALGKDKVMAVTMPSKFSSSETLNDAIDMAKILDVSLHQISIEKLYNVFTNSLSNIWGPKKDLGLTEENLQARIRGNIIMALSNEFNCLLISTGNKSEIAMGYCTLYGDMCGGFALIKDVPKTLVYQLCKWRNQKNYVIPISIINRPPSAELRPNQKDSDTLPPYEDLDPILEAYIEEDKSINELIQEGYDEVLVKQIINAVDKNEYKRRQSPPGVKITPRSFDKDRRMPIVNKYYN